MRCGGEGEEGEGDGEEETYEQDEAANADSKFKWHVKNRTLQVEDLDTSLTWQGLNAIRPTSWQDRIGRSSLLLPNNDNRSTILCVNQQFKRARPSHLLEV